MSNRTQKLCIQCFNCKKTNVLMVDPVDYDNYMQGKEFVQVCFPYLNAEERELIISKTCPDCWDILFAEEE